MKCQIHHERGNLKMYGVGDKVKIIDAMANNWIGRESEITRIISVNPICYELKIGGGHWLHSTLKKLQ
jgi:hypothetical protein